jgi:LDH2 family malate/lactate/ureidoglycolate dehydrogenase
LGGHKGYGLAMLVDILSAILSDANYGAKQEGLMSMRPEPSNVGHFFMAFQVEGFRPLDEFEKTMDQALASLKESPKAKGQDRIFIHGEPEFEFEDERKKQGVPLHPHVVISLTNLAKEAGIDPGQYL